MLAQKKGGEVLRCSLAQNGLSPSRHSKGMNGHCGYDECNHSCRLHFEPKGREGSVGGSADPDHFLHKEVDLSQPSS